MIEDQRKVIDDLTNRSPHSKTWFERLRISFHLDEYHGRPGENLTQWLIAARHQLKAHRVPADEHMLVLGEFLHGLAR